MNLTDMRALVRRDLHDEDDADYRWTDDELDRQIARAVKELSEALPLEQKASLNTTGGSWEIQVGSLANRVTIDRVEYPVGRFPASCPRFSVWNEVLTLLDGDLPDGSQCHIYYGKLHTLDSHRVPQSRPNMKTWWPAGPAVMRPSRRQSMQSTGLIWAET
jgi:hypothetical protein